MLKDANDKETEAKVSAIFSKWAKQENSQIKQIATRTELRKLEAVPQEAVPQAAMMLEALPGYAFDDTLTGEEIRDSGGTYKGTHGYLPTDPRMRASLIIYGLGVRSSSKLPLARTIDLTPSIASLLKLKLPRTEGKPLKELLNNGVTK